MKYRIRNFFLPRWINIWPLAPLLGVFASVGAEPPRIDRIEFFLTNQVTIHFDTDANRTYELQYRNLNSPTAAWTYLYEAPRLPFPNHYIFVDSRTNGARIYRLKVTP